MKQSSRFVAQGGLGKLYQLKKVLLVQNNPPELGYVNLVMPLLIWYEECDVDHLVLIH